MDDAIRALAKVLTVFGLVGAVGCAMVIPKTAFDLFSTFFSDKEEDEVRAAPTVVPASQAEPEDLENALPGKPAQQLSGSKEKKG